MSIQSVKSTNIKSVKKTNYVKITGYASAGLAVASVFCANKKKIKLHKNLAYGASALALLHIGIVEWYQYKFRKPVKK